MKRNFLPASSGLHNAPPDDEIHASEPGLCLRLNDANKSIDTNAGSSFTKENGGQTLHGRLKDIKEQLNPIIDGSSKTVGDNKYQSKFRRSGVVLNNGIYENRQSLPIVPTESNFSRKGSAQASKSKANDILTEGGIRALNKIENTPLQGHNKAVDLSCSSSNQPLSLMALPIVHRNSNASSVKRDASEKFKSISTCSNYDTVAAPVGDNNRRKNPFKVQPGSTSCIFGDQNASNSSDIQDALCSKDSSSKALVKSNVFLRAARSITKTKSVQGSFIVKTTICRSINSKVMSAVDDSRDESSINADGQNPAFMPCITKQASCDISPRAASGSK